MSFAAALMNQFSTASSSLVDRQRARLASERVNPEDDEGARLARREAPATDPGSPAGVTPAAGGEEGTAPPLAATSTTSTLTFGHAETALADEEEDSPTTDRTRDEEEGADGADGEEDDILGGLTYRATMTLAELEEERELARRRMSACVLFTVFVLFKLWVDVLQNPSLPLLMICLIGTSWTARWIRYNRDREEELDRRISQYLAQANARGGDSTNGEAGVMDRHDLRMLSFQAQLALAIMESQRHIQEGGRPDGNGASAGVSSAARAHWKEISYADSTVYGSCTRDNNSGSSAIKEKEMEGPHCSICLSEYENGETLLQLPCQHLYHDDCINSWTANHTKCPLCNFDLEAATEGSAEENPGMV